LGRRIAERPFGAFVLLTFAISWFCWLLFYVTPSPVSEVMFFVGGLGPLVAAALVTWHLGSLRDWGRRLVRWRVSPWFYLFALGFPVVLYAVANGLALLFGAERDLSMMDGIVPAYAATWGTVVFLGGLEEPGWRGFALPNLQQRLTPVRATLLIGVVWGLWHLPVSPLAIVTTIPLSFFYTWLFNRTTSALLCLLLHASITPAQEHLRLTADNVTLQVGVVLTLVASAVAFVVLTRGRLGLPSRA
jgi:membrane protease YdiL (CAAX protease family)